MVTPRSRAEIAIELLERTAGAVLAGKVLGLVGYGALGREIAWRAVGRGMQVLYADLEPGAGPHRRVVLSDLLEHSDFVMPIADGQMPALLRPRLKPGACLVDFLGHVEKLALA
jgi:D-isomer specific 2-hydroxyacid dehydrogenase-like protein